MDNVEFVNPRMRPPHYFQPNDQVVCFLYGKEYLPYQRNSFTMGTVLRVVDRPASKTTDIEVALTTDRSAPLAAQRSFPLRSAAIMLLSDWNLLARQSDVRRLSGYVRNSDDGGNNGALRLALMQAFARTTLGPWQPINPADRDSGMQPAETLLIGDPVVAYNGNLPEVTGAGRLVEGMVGRVDEQMIYVLPYSGDTSVQLSVPYRSPFVMARWAYEFLREHENAIPHWVASAAHCDFYGYRDVDPVTYAELLKNSFNHLPVIDCRHYLELR